MQNKKIIVGITLTILGGIFWGLSGSCGEFLFQTRGATAQWLVPIRLILSGTILLIITAFREKKRVFTIWKAKKNAFDLIIFGLVGLSVCQFTYFYTIELSNAGTATVIQYTSPIMVTIAVCIMEKKLPTVYEIIGLVMAFFGVAAIATHGKIGSLAVSAKVLIVGIISAASVVMYNLQPRALMAKFGTPLPLSWAMIIGGITLMILFKPWRYNVEWDLGAFAALGSIIVFGTICAFSFYLTGVGMIGPTKASLFASVEPVSAAAISTLWLGSDFGIWDFAGLVLIVSMLFILSFGGRKELDKKH